MSCPFKIYLVRLFSDSIPFSQLLLFLDLSFYGYFNKSVTGKSALLVNLKIDNDNKRPTAPVSNNQSLEKNVMESMR